MTEPKLIEVPITLTKEQEQFLQEQGLLEVKVIDNRPEDYDKSQGYFEEITYVVQVTEEELRELIKAGVEVA